MAEYEIVVYGTNWCGDCARVRFLLNHKRVPYHWVNIDRDKEGERYVLKVNKGMRSVPTILFADGSLLVEPSNSELINKLKLNQVI